MTTCVAIFDNWHFYIWSDGQITNSDLVTKKEDNKNIVFKDYIISGAWPAIVFQTIQLKHHEISIKTEKE